MANQFQVQVGRYSIRRGLWRVGASSWIHTFCDDVFWTTPGGDFAQTASAVTAVDPVVEPRPSWSSAQMTADVQGWVDDSSQQFGWILIGNEAIGRTSLAFDSREQALAEDRPQLVFEYTPEPGAALQTCVGLVCLALLRRAATRRD